MKNKILPNGAWTESESQQFSPPLCDAIIQFLKAENCGSVIDMGCGHGRYTKAFQDAGLPNCSGVDGNPNTHRITSGLCSVLDLSIPVCIPPRDWVVSLEVGEHIPKVCAAVFIDNLCRNAVWGIILSWAVVGQGGHGHVNEQPNEVIEGVLGMRGFQIDRGASATLRSAVGAECPWFKNTVMVFRRQYT